MPASITSNAAAACSGNMSSTLVTNGNLIGSTVTSGTITASSWFPTSAASVFHQSLNSGMVISQIAPNSLKFAAGGKELVTLLNSGEVVWHNDVVMSDAADAFAQSLTLGAEQVAGITTRVKQQMRDTVFEEIISMAEQKGSLSADDLTYLWQAAKIIDKLKGGK